MKHAQEDEAAMRTALIRSMTPADLDFAARCTQAEGWDSETRAQFEIFHAHDPDGCLVAESGGEPLGICVATPYGATGFIGELIVVPGARGRGIGRRLLDRALEHLHARGARSVYLDGMSLAVPLYERAGFRKLCRSLRLAGDVTGRETPSVRPMRSEDLDAVAAFDAAAFGADRRYFLEQRLQRYPDLCRVLDAGGIAGFALGRPGEDWTAVGPWIVARGAPHPEDLISAVVPAGATRFVGIGVLETNAAALNAASALGLAEQTDSPWRMVHGPDAGLGASGQCYAVGSPAKG